MRAPVVLLAMLGSARAEPLSLAPGEVAAQLVLEVDASPDHKGNPTSLAPDLWYGAASRWTVGLIHSNPSVDRIRAGASFCLRQQIVQCDHFYRGSGLDVRYRALDWLAPRARFVVQDVSPAKPALMLGALARWQFGWLAITGDPYLRLGLANTDRGNRSGLVLPVELAAEMRRVTIAFDTGWNSDLAVSGDGWHVPVAVGATVHATCTLDVGAMLGFTTILGRQNTSHERVVMVTARLTTVP